ncbi:MAG: cytochrome c [Vicinamibacterales bacterium]
MRTGLVGVVVGLLTAGGVLRAETAIERGAVLYGAQKCAMCHAVAGKGNAKGPLDGVGKKLSAEDIRQWIVDAPGMTARTKAPRRPAMKAYSLPKEDVEALVAYMVSLK